MEQGELNVVTGAFGYTGKYIARRLLQRGRRVLTLTGHPNRVNPFGDGVRTAPYNFERPAELVRSLEGATTLYNTYWVRFPHGGMTYEKAVRNSKVLFRAAAEAGVKRIVHVSITNASLDSPLPYFRGKAELEKALAESGLSYAIIRPTVVFGVEDILINNIAWLVRHFPLFAVPGSGQYRVQPIYVEDLAEVAVEAGESAENLRLDVVGPDVFTFDELVRVIAHSLDRHVLLVHVPPVLAFFLARLIGLVMRDVLLTQDELRGLMADLLVSDEPPSGQVHLAEWLADHATLIGTTYASELNRHYR